MMKTKPFIVYQKLTHVDGEIDDFTCMLCKESVQVQRMNPSWYIGLASHLREEHVDYWTLVTLGETFVTIQYVAELYAIDLAEHRNWELGNIKGVLLNE